MVKSGTLYKLKFFIHLWNIDDEQRFDRKGEVGENIIIISEVEERDYLHFVILTSKGILRTSDWLYSSSFEKHIEEI